MNVQAQETAAAAQIANEKLTVHVQQECTANQLAEQQQQLEKQQQQDQQQADAMLEQMTAVAELTQLLSKVREESSQQEIQKQDLVMQLGKEDEQRLQIQDLLQKHVAGEQERMRLALFNELRPQQRLQLQAVALSEQCKDLSEAELAQHGLQRLVERLQGTVGAERAGNAPRAILGLGALRSSISNIALPVAQVTFRAAMNLVTAVHFRDATLLC